MAEPLGWLKLGQQPRTPTYPLAASLPEPKATRDPQSGDPRPPSLSRMSSYTTSLDTGPKPLPTSGDDNDDTGLFVRSEDKVWYNPSLDQMVESLQVLLMTRGVLEPIPIEYNSYVLHLVEGFAKARANIRRVEGACQEARQSLEHNLEEFRQVADDWAERESQYRAEVKRLEVLLSRSSRGGLEAVTLARTNSIVDRSGFRDGGLLSRLNKFRKHLTNDSESLSTPFLTTETQSIRASDGGSSSKAPTPRILDNDNDFRMSEKIRRQDAVAKASATSSRDRRACRQGEMLRPELNDGRDCYDRLHSPFTDILTIPFAASEEHDTYQDTPMPTKMYVRDGLSTSLSSKASYHQDESLNIPTVSVFDLPARNEETRTEAAFRHDQGHSGSSFEPIIDSDLLLDNRINQHPLYDEQAQSHSADGNCEGKRRQHYTDNNDGTTIGSTSGKERKQSVENSNPVVHRVTSRPHTVSSKLGQAGPDSGCGRQPTTGSSPSQSTHSCDSPTVTSITIQDSPQRQQQAGTNARIAATLALANVRGGTSQRK
ncbi:hypothetical protein F5Y10DRAFT_293387 [Nemania abortiva]|nr:hypothetical protein F5Y10DRAFT_293387 [Nemania abortiva]